MYSRRLEGEEGQGATIESLAGRKKEPIGFSFKVCTDASNAAFSRLAHSQKKGELEKEAVEKRKEKLSSRLTRRRHLR